MKLRSLKLCVTVERGMSCHLLIVADDRCRQRLVCRRSSMQVPDLPVTGVSGMRFCTQPVDGRAASAADVEQASYGHI